MKNLLRKHTQHHFVFVCRIFDQINEKIKLNQIKKRQPIINCDIGIKILQIAISGWLTGHYNFRCQPVDYSNNPRTLRVCVLLFEKQNKKKTKIKSNNSRRVAINVCSFSNCIYFMCVYVCTCSRTKKKNKKKEL